MRKFLKSILNLFLGILLCFSISSCSEEKAKIELSGFDYCFLLESEVNDFNEIELKENSKPTSFKIDEKYYLVIVYDITLREKKLKEEKTITTTIKMSSVGFVDGYVDSTEGGAAKERNPIYDDKGEEGVELLVEHRLPKEKDTTKNIKIVMRMTALQVTENDVSSYLNPPKLSIDVSGNETVEIKDYDKFPVERSIVVKKAVLDTPIISYNEDTQRISFKHIKKADYYKIYVDEKEMEERKIVEDYVTEGTEITWDMGSFLDGRIKPYSIQIQAFSNNINYIPSTLSETISVKI